MIFHVASLGCARNLVDSESMTGRLIAAGHETTEDPGGAEVIVVILYHLFCATMR